MLMITVYSIKLHRGLFLNWYHMRNDNASIQTIKMPKPALQNTKTKSNLILHYNVNVSFAEYKFDAYNIDVILLPTLLMLLLSAFINI